MKSEGSSRTVSFVLVIVLVLSACALGFWDAFLKPGELARSAAPPPSASPAP